MALSGASPVPHEGMRKQSLSAGERPPPRSLGARLRKLLFATAVALLSLEAIYVVGINVFLSTSLFDQALGREPEIIAIHFRRGWSVLPGRIHARDISIRGADSNVEWRLTLQEIEFDVSFKALSEMRFEVSRARGRGTTFRARQKVDAPPPPAAVAALPPIEGFGLFTLRPPRSLDEREVWNDDYWKLWTARLENVVAEDVREVWVDGYHFEGNARIDGRFYLKPIRRVEIGPIRVDIANGKVSRGSTVIASDLGGALELTVDPFDPRLVHGSDLLHRVSAKTDVHLRIPSAHNLLLDMPEGSAVRASLEIANLGVRIDHGVLASPSRGEFVSKDFELDVGPHHAVAGASAKFSVAKVNGRDRFTLDIELSGAALARKETSKLIPLASAERAHATIDSQELDLVRPFEDMHAVLDLPAGKFPDARAYDLYVPPAAPIDVLGGSGQVGMHAEYWSGEQRARGKLTIAANDLDFRLAKLRIKGTTRIDASVDTVRFDPRLPSPLLEGTTVAMVIDTGSVASLKHSTDPAVSVRGLRIDASAKVVEFADPLRDMAAKVVLADATIVDRGLLDQYLPTEGPRAGLVEPMHFSAACDAVIANHLARGTVDLRSKGISFGRGEYAVDGDVSAHARVHAWQWERGILAVDEARLEAKNVRVRALAAGKKGRASISVEAVRVKGSSPLLDIGDPLRRVNLAAAVVGAKVHDSAALNAFLPHDADFALVVDDAALASEVVVTVENHVASGSFKLGGRGLGIQNASMIARGNVDVAATISNWELDNDKMRIDSARLSITDARGRISNSATDQFTAKKVQIEVGGLDFVLASPTYRGADAHLVIEDAKVVDARALNALLPATPITIESGSAHVAADLEFSSARGVGKGILDVQLRRAGFTVHETKLVGDMGVLLRVRGFDQKNGTIDIGGSQVAIRNLDVSHTSTPTQNWFGDVFVERGVLDLQNGGIIRGDVRLEARDANPVLAVLLRNSLPKIFVGLTTMPHLRATAHLDLSPSSIVVRNVALYGGNVLMRGMYASQNESTRGAFIVGKGAFAAGLRIDDIGIGVHFFDLNTWLNKETRAVEAFVAQPPTNARRAATKKVDTAHPTTPRP